MTEPTVNIPLLRKAVEWAEAEAARPRQESRWFQGSYVWDAESRSIALGVPATECGTAYCIAGYVGVLQDSAFNDSQWRIDDVTGVYTHVAEVAQEALGITSAQADDLFKGDNSIKRVRQVAEQIAGKKL